MGEKEVVEEVGEKEVVGEKEDCKLERMTWKKLVFPLF